MSLPKKKSRRISVDGVSYRWMLSGRTFYAQAESVDGTPLLRADLHERFVVGYPEGGSSEYEKVASPFTPRDAKTIISVAVTRGWTPITPAKEKLFELRPVPFTRNHGPKNESMRLTCSESEARELFKVLSDGAAKA